MRVPMSIALLSLIPATAVGANAVGINTHIPSPEVLDEVAAMGMTWIRVDNDWHSFEPRQGEYHFGALDRSVRAAHERGQKVFMTIGYTPEWASSGRRTDTIPSSHNQVPRPGLYEAYVRETVRHYRDMGVTHFGLWNEANLDQFFEGSAREYADIIVIPGEQAVRQACADCVVLGPELAPVGDVDEFLEAVMDACGDRFDIVTHHLYGDWEETGWRIWDGDSFLNALEDQRFPWTRRSMRQVLESTGYGDVEVWITETGWRENPIGDPEERRLQAVYARRVLEEQWQRDWWTNTFFYEITDAIGFDIDGFGFVRPREGGGFERKPVFDEVRNFLAGHPQTDPAPEPAPDPDPDPDPEDDPAVDPPNDRLEAIARQAHDRPSIDAQLDDWAGAEWIELDRAGWQSPDGFVLDGPADLSAEFAVQWDESTLFFAVRVRDDIHHVADDPALAWTADSVQIAFDPRNDGGEGYGDDDQELGLFDSGAHHWHGGGGPIAATVAVRRDSGTTVYEAAIPLALISPVHTMGSIGFDILVNDADGAGREGWLEWAGGMGWAKRPEIFGRLRFVDADVAPPEDDVDPEDEEDPAEEDPAGDPGGGEGDPPEEQRDRDEPSVEIGDRDTPASRPLPTGDLGEGQPVGPPEDGLAEENLVDEDAGGDGESGCAVSRRGSVQRLFGGLVGGLIGGLLRRR